MLQTDDFLCLSLVLLTKMARSQQWCHKRLMKNCCKDLSATDLLISASNHQQQRPAKKVFEEKKKWKISNNRQRDKETIRFIHVRERNLIIMLYDGQHFFTALRRPHLAPRPRWKRYFMMLSFNQISCNSLRPALDHIVCSGGAEWSSSHWNSKDATWFLKTRKRGK